MTASGSARVWIRIPLIPGYNDSEEHARAVVNLMAKMPREKMPREEMPREKMPVEKISLLDYHEWGKPKYGFLGRDYPFGGEVGEDQRTGRHRERPSGFGICGLSQS